MYSPCLILILKLCSAKKFKRAVPLRDMLASHKAGLQKMTTGDWLVSQLQSLIDIAFRMATGNVEALRSSGLQLLKVFVSNSIQFDLGHPF